MLMFPHKISITNTSSTTTNQTYHLRTMANLSGLIKTSIRTTTRTNSIQGHQWSINLTKIDN